jgi:outer membrane lipoprotein-sorting protein
MKSTHTAARVALGLALAILVACPIAVRPQDPNELMPAQSAAMARTILDQAVAALGGQAYLEAQDYDCKGRYGNFDSVTGQSGGSVEARFMRQFPDKTRTEMDSKNFITDIYGIPISSKGRVVMVYTADSAWSVSAKGAITDLGPDTVATYNEQLKNDMNAILRSRLNEDGLVLRYAGADLVDLKQVDWVEITDKSQQTTRIAIDKKTHLPVRSVALSRDTLTNIRVETAHAYSNYHMIGGLEIPFQTEVIINEQHPSSQTFYSSCQVDVGLPSHLFDRPAFDADSGKAGDKHK